MGQAARTTKLLLDLSTREQGGANAGKREHLAATVAILNAARRFYLDFFLAHPDKLTERVEIISKKTGEVREGVISAENLLTWAEFQTVATREHPDPLPNWNFSQTFPDFPIRGEPSNQQIWTHVRHQNRDTAHKTARAIVEVCERYAGCVLVFERLRTIRASGAASRGGSTANKPIK